jgi:Flp pilus assembly protein TadD
VASGEIERAKPALVRAAELRPEDDELRFQLGLALEAEGDLAAAIAAHRAARQQEPANEQAARRLSELAAQPTNTSLPESNEVPQ